MILSDGDTPFAGFGDRLGASRDPRVAAQARTQSQTVLRQAASEGSQHAAERIAEVSPNGRRRVIVLGAVVASVVAAVAIGFVIVRRRRRGGGVATV